MPPFSNEPFLVTDNDLLPCVLPTPSLAAAMERSPVSTLLSALLQPSWQAIVLSVMVALLLPVLLHVSLYRKAASTNQPTFLLLGTSGAGKTSLLTLVGLFPQPYSAS